MLRPDEPRMVEESLEVADRVCNGWEIKFLESLQERFEKDPGYELSTKQSDKLGQIYGKVCRSPY